MTTYKIKRRTIKLLTLGLYVLSSCLADNKKTIEMTINQVDTPNQVSIKADKQNISSLYLIVKGEIKGSGLLTIGDTDSTTYITYELTDGPVNLKYDGDWYSEFCFVTCKPTSVTTGQLKIEGRFY